MHAAALILAAGLALALPHGASAAAPTCPGEVGGLKLEGKDVVEAANSATLQCSYVQRTDDGGSGVSMTVTWQVRKGASAVVGAAPCTGATEVSRENETLSIASGTHHVGSYVSASVEKDGVINPTAVPEGFEPVLRRLVAQAETVAIGCDGEEAGGTAPPTATTEAGGGADAGKDEEPSNEEILIAAGLIMLLLSGFGPLLPQLLKRMSRGHFEDRAVQRELELDSAPLEPVRPARPPRPPVPTVPPPPPVTPEQVQALQDEFANRVRDKLDAGHWVRNPTVLAKVWSTIRDPFWRMKSGQCGEFAADGARWMREYVGDQFGPHAIVDTVQVTRRSALAKKPDLLDRLDSFIPVNHEATRVILPDGRRYVLDFWESMGRSQGEAPKLIAEEHWRQQWESEIPSGRMWRSEMEMQLLEAMEHMPEERAIEMFRRNNAKVGRSAEAETLIRSWRANPW